MFRKQPMSVAHDIAQNEHAFKPSAGLRVARQALCGSSHAQATPRSNFHVLSGDFACSRLTVFICQLD